MQARLFMPRFWPIWLGAGLFALLGLLPLRAQWGLGAALGRAGYHLARGRRHTVRVNLALCFPQMPAAAREALVREVFRSVGISLMETALIWLWAPKEKDFDKVVDIHGLERLEAAYRQGKGVLLVGPHLATLDYTGAALGCKIPIDVMYRRNKNPMLEALMIGGRGRYFPNVIDRGDVRRVIRRLRAGAIVWYGADQDYGSKVSVFAPFFKVPAATISATSRFADACGCPVIFLTHYRNLATGRYDIWLEGPLRGFPSGNLVKDASLINRYIEEGVMRAPEQYWWIHRRFKTRPPGEPKLY